VQDVSRQFVESMFLRCISEQITGFRSLFEKQRAIHEIQMY